jgi:hypothetical protein
MKPLPLPPAVQLSQEDRGTTCPTACLLCGGDLVPLRGTLRCSRCGFLLCEGCDGQAADD